MMNRSSCEWRQKAFCSLMIITALLLLHEPVRAQDEEQIVIGRKVKIQSSILEKEMRLSIHIPHDYENSNERYPVLYVFQTHFELISGAVKCLYDYNLIPRIICVQIDNYEFAYLTPTRIERDPNSGRADAFLEFFRKELFPFMASHYRVRDYRIIFSNSWGAAFIVYSMLTQPDLFQTGIASIPWVNYEDQNRFIIENAADILKRTAYHNNYLYMTMDNETELLPDLETFIGILEANPKPGLEWEYHHWPEEDHTSTPYRSIYAGLCSLFMAWRQIPDDIAGKGLEGIKEYEITLKDKYGYEIGVSTFALRQAGVGLKNEKKYHEAIEIFKYEIEKNPHNPFAHVALGRAYEESNQLDSAKEAYEEAYRVAVATSHHQVEWVKGFLDNINQRLGREEK